VVVVVVVVVEDEFNWFKIIKQLPVPGRKEGRDEGRM
jgi:hypothetical protein